MIIDLTQTLTSQTLAFPGDTNPEIVQIESGGIMDHRITTGMHIGTHIDGPRHMLPTGKFLHEFPIEKFCGRGVVVNGEGKNVIDADALETTKLTKGDIVIIHTGQSKRFGTNAYFKNAPVLSTAFAQKLIEAEISIIGLDFASPDGSPYEIHKMLLAKEILIIENLTQIEKLLLSDHFSVQALPLKVAADSAPARVIALI